MKASCMPVFLTHAKGEPALTAGDEALVCKACINELWGPHALTHRNACNKLHALVLPVWALDPVPHLLRYMQGPEFHLHIRKVTCTGHSCCLPERAPAICTVSLLQTCGTLTCAPCWHSDECQLTAGS